MTDACPRRLREKSAGRRWGASVPFWWEGQPWWGSWRTFAFGETEKEGVSNTRPAGQPAADSPNSAKQQGVEIRRYLRRLSGKTPGDSEAGTVSVSVTGVVAVVVSSRELLMKDVVLEADGLVVTGVWAC